jgi:hypothetical protein
MTDEYAPDSTPSIEVSVFRHDELVERRLCESEEEAAEVVAQWSELDDVTCLVDDLSFHHAQGDVLEPEPVETPDEDYDRNAT